MYYREGFVVHDFRDHTEYNNTNYYYITIASVPNPAGNRPLNSRNVYRFLFGDTRHIPL